MQVKFIKDVFASGTKVFANGQQLTGGDELAKHVRRGEAVEVTGKAAIADAQVETKTEAKGGGKGSKSKK